MNEDELTEAFKKTIAQLKEAKFEHLATKKERDDIRKEKADNDGTLTLEKKRHYSALTRKFNREIPELQELRKTYNEQKKALLDLGAKEEELPTVEDDIGTGSDEEETDEENDDDNDDPDEEDPPISTPEPEPEHFENEDEEESSGCTRKSCYISVTVCVIVLILIILLIIFLGQGSSNPYRRL